MFDSNFIFQKSNLIEKLVFKNAVRNNAYIKKIGYVEF